MKNKQPDISELHQQFEEVTSNEIKISEEQRNKIRFPYEVLISADKGWIPCAILEVDSEKELAQSSILSSRSCWVDRNLPRWSL